MGVERRAFGIHIDPDFANSRRVCRSTTAWRWFAVENAATVHGACPRLPSSSLDEIPPRRRLLSWGDGGGEGLHGRDAPPGPNRYAARSDFRDSLVTYGETRRVSVAFARGLHLQLR